MRTVGAHCRHVGRLLLGEAMTVLAAIEADNSRECFERQRQGYERSRDRLVQICDGLHGWERWRVYRAHNDRRFRKELPAVQDVPRRSE